VRHGSTPTLFNGGRTHPSAAAASGGPPGHREGDAVPSGAAVASGLRRPQYATRPGGDAASHLRWSRFPLAVPVPRRAWRPPFGPAYSTTVQAPRSASPSASARPRSCPRPGGPQPPSVRTHALRSTRTRRCGLPRPDYSGPRAVGRRLVASGSDKTKVAPRPCPADVAVTSPPWARARPRAMVRPIPDPSDRRVLPGAR